MVMIRVDSFQPFESRADVDTVIRLRFSYDATVVAQLKDALAWAAGMTGMKNVGGWLPQHRVWFCERAVWHLVRSQLMAAGCQFVDEPAPRSGGMHTSTPAPPRPACPQCRQVPTLLERWAWEMRT
jgi:hypothetical protein